MTLCLNHPTLGYYTTRTVFGKEGDFVTSPEISQVFGELLAIWYVTQWLAQGSPKRVRVVELGPGRGTLLADILRTFRALPQPSRPPISSIHLVEQSDQLKRVQKARLVETGFGETPVEWHADVAAVPQSEDEFTILIAHEFFDALPIHIFENTQKGWREVLSPLTLNVDTTLGAPPRSASSPSSPAPSAARAAPPASTPGGAGSLTAQRFARLPIGSRIEVSPSSWEVARDTARLVGGPAGGAGLVVDYGDAKAFGRSWRGFRKHQVVDPLTEPGHTDLTANVDFSYLAESMSEFASTHGPLPQSRFLTSLGLQPRLAGLLRGASTDERRKEIESAAKRLVYHGGMGSQYKVMAVTPKGAKDVFPFDLVE
ncbi:uncharacterized protein RHOBADRAFT_33470 [Rhodotorula graminis WP1]|uniref:Protein arginine methyltransferase NDUFAF7 n=1 Tax=Rhodotorula graminis (strain WP1) TaxID=578459 RepID=A0A194SD16_RHOGW|nr:uncharacterized protein RHOBADRAFT_33470 [Rhodotorula graminis WP1]KPV77291.1 hypothetical protein RHOBADRAFT_33470 [Rhodotorula graminis WP1]